MTRRRWALLGAAILLVAVLVGGRWSAIQTAERAWAETIPAGAAYLHGLALARLVGWIVTLVALAWGIGHCYLVYRAIGSVQMPRRVGDIEIVEAVPHRLLITITLAAGLLYGLGLAWAIGGGDVWRQAILAGVPPHFGVTDSILHYDLGYYVAELPWARTRQGMLLLGTSTAAVLIVTLYAAIGSLRLQGGRVTASPHARTHLGLTLAGLALAFLWGAYLDPAETVAGLAGPVTQAALAVRQPGASVVAGVAIVAAFLSAIWGWWDRPGAVAGSWLALLGAMLVVYVILPPGTRLGPISAADSALTLEKRALEGVAFGAAPETWTPAAQSPAEAAATIPVWDPARIKSALRDSTVGPGVTVAGARLEASGRWILGLSPDGQGLLRVSPPPTWESVHQGPWAHAPGPLEVREADSGLAVAHAAGEPAETWFGAGFLDYAVVDSGTLSGIPLTGGWRRLALAWALQAPELTRASLAGHTLLWRRDAVTRFSALAPFAHFGPATPALVGSGSGGKGSLWWLSWGSVESETFPLVDTVMVGGRALRYRRAGVLAGMNAATGATRLWLSPETDSLTAAWARILTPLIAPADSIPPEIRTALQYPAEMFAIDARILAHAGLAMDSAFHWKPLDPEPYVLAAAGPGDTVRRVWLLQAFVDSMTKQILGGVLAGTVTPKGPRLLFWTPLPLRIPQPLSSDPERRAGVLRLWPTDASVIGVQARFWQPQEGPAAPRLDSVFVSVGPEVAGDANVPAALRAVLRGPDLALGSPTASLREVRALFARMDSALAAGQVSRFGVLYDSLRAFLRATSRAVAPATGPR